MKWLPGLFLVLTPAALADVQLPKTFYFAPNGPESTLPLYDAERGYGLEPDGSGQFSVRVPEGNYRVTVRLGSKRLRAQTTVLAEQRRLMLEGVQTAPGKFAQRSFVVNTRTAALGVLPANAPGGTAVLLKPRETGALNWDDKITLQFSPGIAALNSVRIESADVPTLYLAGDSTVTDQPLAPNASWGQMLPRFFAGGIAVANHAESGETLKSFVTELRFDKLLSRLRRGDWVMIQFAHNDQKTQWPQTYADAATTYRAWLRAYIAEIRQRGATPILVTSPERRNFDAAGQVESTLGDYPAAMRAVATEERVALVDLNALSRQFYAALGPQVAPHAFADGGVDKTHFNEYGAYQLARCVIEGLRSADPALLAGLPAHFAADAGRYDASRPAPPLS